MSVPKYRRNKSEVEYFNNAYKIEEKVIKYLLADFGTTHTYRDLRIFAFKAKMNEEDTKTLEELKIKYNLDLETTYPEYILSYFREAILVDCRELMSLITKAHTMYPTSVYEYNVRRQYQSDAISICYDMKHNMQLCIKIFNSKHIEKFVDIVNDIDTEIALLKQWRKDGNKVRKECFNNDEQRKVNAYNAVTKNVNKRVTDNEFLFRIINNGNINGNIRLDKETLIYNMQHATIYVDPYGRLRSNLYIPAIYYTNPLDENSITNFGFC